MQSDELIRLLVNQTAEFAVLLTDPQGVITWINPAAEGIFSISRGEAIGKPTGILFTEEDVAGGADVNEVETAAVAPSASDDRWLVRADGSRFWASGALTRIQNESGQTIAFGKILRNRTDLREYIEALRNKVEAAGTNLSRKDHFLSTLSHELRNPLAPLLHAIEVIKLAAPDAPVVVESVAILERQIGQLRRLIEDLLDLSRIQHGKIELQLADVDLHDVIQRSVDAVRPLITRKQHHLQVILPEGDMRVRGDAMRLEQIFVNLLTNAAKYTLVGGNIWVKGTFEADEAVIHVQDSGVGIPADMLMEIFDLFTQVESSSALSSGGLGIGLALVAQLVELHNGYVHARSDGPGKGSEFTVRLPRIQVS